MKNSFKKIDDKLFPYLKNKEIENKQIIITFSGVPGSGKTTIAKNLEKKYNAVRINNDSIRKIISNNGFAKSDEEVEELLQKYNFYLISHLPFRNKRIILDKSLDRRYKWFEDICKKYNLNYFIIRLVSKNPVLALKRLSKREEINSDLKKTMERWFGEYNDFGKNFKSDIILGAERPDMKKLFRKLDEILE